MATDTTTTDGIQPMSVAVASHRVGLTRSDVAAPKLRRHFRTISFHELPSPGDAVTGRRGSSARIYTGRVVHVGAVFTEVRWDGDR